MGEVTDNQALVGVVEATEAWTIKAFSRSLRLAAVNAARVEGVTTGQWLERCVRDRLESDVQPAAQRALPAPDAAPAQAPPPLDMAGLAQLLSVLGEIPDGLRRDAVRTTRAMLRQARRAIAEQSAGLPPVRVRTSSDHPRPLREAAASSRP